MAIAEYKCCSEAVNSLFLKISVSKIMEAEYAAPSAAQAHSHTSVEGQAC